MALPRASRLGLMGTMSRLRLVPIGLALLLVLYGAMAGPVGGSRSLATRIGVAVVGHGTACLAIENPRLRPGARIVLVSPMTPRRLSGSIVLGHGRACPGWRGAGIAAYRLRPFASHLPPGLVMFALPGSARFHLDKSGASGRLVSGGRLLRLRACTSTEGVHLTVWRVGARRPRRLLHIYYYLDQDLDADCDSAQTEPPTAASR